MQISLIISSFAQNTVYGILILNRRPNITSSIRRFWSSKDISRIDGKNRDEKLSRQILKSYARNISTLAKKTSMLEDITASKDINCSIPTLDDYITALERLFVIQDIEAWCPAIRSKTTIRSAPKGDSVTPLLR